MKLASSYYLTTFRHLETGKTHEVADTFIAHEKEALDAAWRSLMVEFEYWDDDGVEGVRRCHVEWEFVRVESVTRDGQRSTLIVGAGSVVQEVADHA